MALRTFGETVEFVSKLVGKSMPDAIRDRLSYIHNPLSEDLDYEVENLDPLATLLEQNGWDVKRRQYPGKYPVGTTLTYAIEVSFVQNNTAVYLSYDVFCNTPWCVRWGLFKPWEANQDPQYQKGYLDAIEMDLMAPKDAHFGNGRPVCLIGFSPFGGCMVDYWQPKLMDNNSYFPRGTHAEDEKELLRVLNLIGVKNLSGEKLLGEFNLPEKKPDYL
ncbi:hypothetical protein A3C09_03985 [Candidatus Uhrbacteria bacterium RIFCSPHIGHO2_02_FULL_47_44]|uniref:Uncharacterized protein n=1 Tax=Candidatus Uhrbacteria bacterium RIFCSPLOWO2_02_FULL_48_18 TaxID=1802408 RepID=A0A1F7VDL9_9BACT|nr:MAG: hypothetical protein A2839_01990 [Candidatus Uhrbacteria bacterium RIFCSPHIGHO2_01_FULL_47_10]OGL71837.1 MAG: hypothetical protein A3C09_03985 [Candidatus Uhrbacteria bacterium RIFCSPHIGHO2_02_FULL_47_44]OGL77062.1 MAG: hypothetical protein A3E97_01530 [Candidatus Uhrbacteria bacterium RIFCSPHIGHO2_12_FULL_47_12]OGL80589.1 MAG: hypothetical protein A3B20_04300 [Candidatus Uhrbacteria bacterium RIFCSPLOWO2_01_FULL_47_17]OGL88228.1 MAG: hypothetical protein A3I41_00680 [Candidatus Uhrbact